MLGQMLFQIGYPKQVQSADDREGCRRGGRLHHRRRHWRCVQNACCSTCSTVAAPPWLLHCGDSQHRPHPKPCSLTLNPTLLHQPANLSPHVQWSTMMLKSRCGRRTRGTSLPSVAASGPLWPQTGRAKPTIRRSMPRPQFRPTVLDSCDIRWPRLEVYNSGHNFQLHFDLHQVGR